MPDPIIANLIVLVVVLVLPFIAPSVERNLEAFLFVMGVIAAIGSGVLTLHLIGEAVRDPIPITAAVLFSGLLFAWVRPRLIPALRGLLGRIGPAALSAAAVALLGLASSVITAMIASLVLVEFIAALQLRRADEVRVVVLACFAIGLGAALTPVGEPLATIAIAKLDQDFWFLARLLGPWIVPGVLVLCVATAVLKLQPASEGLTREAERREWYAEVLGRAARVYLFVMGLTLLGEGFRPLIDRFVIGLDARLLYWINMISAILDNATLTAAEISPRMTNEQVRAVLMGLIISGGMLIPGNIPNIIAAGKLSIRSREWARVAVPIGAVLLVVYFALLFLVT